MTTNEDRMKKLQSRFNSPAKEETPPGQTTQPKKDVTRKRHSLYLDKALVERADQAYRDIAHDLYPVEVNKSDFLEACLQYALEHLSEIKESLTEDK